MIWVYIIIGLVVVLVVGWLMMKKKKNGDSENPQQPMNPPQAQA